jgi:hypothetical protein
MRTRLPLFGVVLSVLVSCGAPGRVHGPPSAAMREANGLAIQTCRTAHRGEALANLSFDARGHMTELRVIPSPDHPVDPAQLRCLETALREWSVRVPSHAPSSEVELSLALEPLPPSPVSPPPTLSASPSHAPPFDRGAAASALAEGRRSARTCGVSSGPSGQGHVTVTFSGSGEIRSVTLDSGSFAGTPVGQCVARAYRRVGIVPFEGEDVKVGSVFEVDPVTEGTTASTGSRSPSPER